MKNKGSLTKTLAMAGTLLVWLPIIAPVLLSLVFWFKEKLFRFDYLMPAELFPLALAGGILLLWSAWRAQARLKLIGWALGVALVMLVGGQAFAVVTGIASGAREPAGLSFGLLIASLVVFWLALLCLGGGGIALLTDLFKTNGDVEMVR